MRTVHAVDGDERERAVDGADGGGVAAEHAAPRLLDVEVVQMVQPRIEQIDDAFDRSVHRRILVRFQLPASSFQLSATVIGFRSIVRDARARAARAAP